MDQLGQILHDGRVGLAVVERRGAEGAVEDRHQRRTTQERARRPLQEAREQPKQVVHRVGVLTETLRTEQSLVDISNTTSSNTYHVSILRQNHHLNHFYKAQLKIQLKGAFLNYR